MFTRGALLLLTVVLIATLLVACGGEQSRPDQEIATEVAQSIFATQTQEATEGNTSATVDALETQVAALASAATQAVAATSSAPTDTPTSAPTDTPTPAPATDTPAPTPTASPSDTPTPSQPQAIVNSASLNVRAGPATSHPIVAALHKDDAVAIMGRNQDGSWLLIETPQGKAGWVSAQLVTLPGDAGAIPVAALIPTPPPTSAAPAAPAAPASAARTLEVTFLNPHYECQQREWSYTGDDGRILPLWGYRSFQADMYIKNNGSEAVEPPWQPDKWIISDGSTDYVSDLMWQWVSRQSGFYQQPVIQPGQSAGWTFLAFPLERNQWVKAAEFEWKGQKYRLNFDLGEFGNAHNYKDCGDYAPHTVRPTPTPEP